MTQLTGTVELDLDRVVEHVAQRTAVLVVSMLTADGRTYQREPDPEPEQGSADPDRGRHDPDQLGMDGLPDYRNGDQR